MNVDTDSPGLRERLHLSTISDGFGLKCLDSTSTSAPYSLSPGLSGARRILYLDGPMTERKTARFLSAAVMLLAMKKYSSPAANLHELRQTPPPSPE